MKTLVLTLDAVNPKDVDRMNFLSKLKNKENSHFGRLDCGFPEWMGKGYGGQGHTVSSAGALATGQTPTINGQLANRFRWDSPAVKASKISTHRELDQENYLWDLIDESGYSSLFINYPIMYPPPQLQDGVMISGVLAPPGARFASPKSEEKRLKNGDYVGDLSAHFGSNKKQGWSYIEKGDQQSGEYISDLDKSTLSDSEIRDFAFSMTYNRTEHILSLHEEYDFDVVIGWISSPDRLKHHLSSFENPKELNQELLGAVDSCVKKIVEELEPEHIIIHSDHGFGTPPWEENHHTRYGFFLINSPLKYIGKGGEAHILDIPYTLLQTLNIEVPDEFEGVPMLQSEKDDEAIKGRLRNLGYLDDEESKDGGE